MSLDQTIIEEKEFNISNSIPVDDKTAHEPDITLDANGTPWVVWSARGRDGDSICLRRITTDGTSKNLAVSTVRGIECQPCIIKRPNNTLRITWVAFRGNQWQLILREYDGNAFNREQELTSHIHGIFHPRLHLAEDSTCYLVFEQIIDQRPRLFQMKEKDGVWSKPAELQTPEGACYRPSITEDIDGRVWLAYDVYKENHYSVWLQRLDEAGSPISVANDGYQNLQTSIAKGHDGGLWIAWSGNQNKAYQDPWWLTKWVHLRYFDGERFAQPIGDQLGKDVYNEDSFQGWEFPQVVVDAAGRIWLFGQASHTLYAQYYAGNRWSQLHTISQQRWGSWKPRFRAIGADPIYLVSMGLSGAQLQRLKIKPADIRVNLLDFVKPKPAKIQKASNKERCMITSKKNEKLNVYFGDLHAHSIYGDAVNDVDEFYHRYRDAYGYDFAALTEHDFLDGMEMSQSEYKMMGNHSERMTRPGEFVAFHGYEWTSPALADHTINGGTVGEGHRHVLYSDGNGPLISYGEESANTGKKLLERLKDERALVISHHAAWSGTDWDAHVEELTRLIEVCSAHGRFEYPGNMPIGYRRDHIHPGKFVRDGLARGHRLGFVGSSDSHGLLWHGTEMEGRAAHIPENTRVGWKKDSYRTGMTAILAPELTREALFNALYQRRCYATSGEPIFINFRINGELMGSDIKCVSVPHLSAEVKGTAAIRSIDIVRSGHFFAGTQSMPGEGMTEMRIALDDNIIIPGEMHYYYLRVLQEDGNMAWSSPIWVTYTIL